MMPASRQITESIAANCCWKLLCH